MTARVRGAGGEATAAGRSRGGRGRPRAHARRDVCPHPGVAAAHLAPYLRASQAGSDRTTRRTAAAALATRWAGAARPRAKGGPRRQGAERTA